MEFTRVPCFVCGKEEFRVTLAGRSGGSCAGAAIFIECIWCRDRWELGVCTGASEAGEPGADVEGDQAVGEGGDVAGDVVPAAQELMSSPPNAPAGFTEAERDKYYKLLKAFLGDE